MVLWVCNYHIVWATYNRQPLITPSVEVIVLASIKRKSHELTSPIMAINMVEDHIHVAVKVHPKISVSEWVRQSKGLSTREINERLPDLLTHFRWQQGYSVHTFGEKHKHFVINYIERQKEHHQNQTIEPYLEQME